ncbi:MAG TPA: acyl-ACP--UDP-N-acetylglucosamine O-acyltransferase [Ignavibacteriaceae bacterium]|jgi:UDP-N-acetylglucosamine acyltransferase|nr:acyl-ACP--UDP-N-acetylglucosamine O-acyltransferase [Ignavibacteriaceae bacterium]
MNIHPTAVMDSEVTLGGSVEVGAYCVIRGKVEIGDGCIIKDHAVLYGPLTLGKGNVIHPGAVVGNINQDLKYKGEPSRVIIGDNNSIREFVTIQQGTIANEGKTIIGSSNLIMAYSHIAHDCILGNNIIIANSTQLAGHIIIKDFAYLGGLVGVHQFVTIGRNCFVGFMSRINRDVPPFVIMEGNPSRERSINTEGLKRKNFSKEDISVLRKAFIILFVSEVPKTDKMQLLKENEFAGNQYVRELVASVEASASGKNGRALEAARYK